MPRIYNRLNEVSDVIKWECNPIFCRDGMKVDNTAGSSDIVVSTGECYTRSTATKMTNHADAVPGVWTVKIAKSGDSTADDTIDIAGVTLTAKATPAGDTQFALDATAAAIATAYAKNTVTNFTVTAAGDTLTFTQSTAGTGLAPVNTGTDSTVTATVKATQAAVAEVTGGEASFDSICLENRTIPAGQSLLIQVLCRGPALVDVKNIVNGAESTLRTRLAALDIRVAEPSSKNVFQNT